MSEHTKTPLWTYKRANTPTDGEYDYAIVAEMNGNKYCIAEVFGRVSETVRPDAQSIAALICKAVNSHDALVAALEFIRDGYANQDVNHVDYRVKVYQVALEAIGELQDALEDARRLVGEVKEP